MVPGRLIAGMFPTGTDGWETSFNERFAQRLAPLGVRYDPTRAMTREQWLDNLRRVEATRWGYVLEQPARKPTAAEVKASVRAFVQRAKEERKGVALWLSAMMLRQQEDTEIVRQLWAAVGLKWTTLCGWTSPSSRRTRGSRWSLYWGALFR